jgi:hypothetical protein
LRDESWHGEESVRGFGLLGVKLLPDKALRCWWDGRSMRLATG